MKVVSVMEGEDGRGRSAPLRVGGGAQDSRRFKRGREGGKGEKREEGGK